MTVKNRTLREKDEVIQQKEGVIRDNEELIQTLLVRMLVSYAEQIAAGCWVDLEGSTGPLFERCNGI